jgi:hypothetical protein
MVVTKKLYRVSVKTTRSLQPGSGGTHWQWEVLYCGYDVDEARRVYHASRPLDHGGSYGNACRETVAQSKTYDD